MGDGKTHLSRPPGPPGGEVYAADLCNMRGGGVIEEIGVRLATKLGEKWIKKKNNVLFKKIKKVIDTNAFVIITWE